MIEYHSKIWLCFSFSVSLISDSAANQIKLYCRSLVWTYLCIVAFQFNSRELRFLFKMPRAYYIWKILAQGNIRFKRVTIQVPKHYFLHKQINLRIDLH
ncbi:hypothetical protein F5X96DRAFT_664832 [Biscogniauxia mediterranea]|nr:hypothetical protein F5X96DRAFT_664832 [Biscogniauxia mediterranea]